MIIFVILRIIIGTVFFLSGVEKLSSPYQNFLYIIEHYDVIPQPLDKWTAMLLPWGELILGSFTILGLWTKAALRANMVLFGLFVGIIGQALLRKLPLGECGCFGEWISIPPSRMIILDMIFFSISYLLLRNINRTERWSLDSYFNVQPGSTKKQS